MKKIFLATIIFFLAFSLAFAQQDNLGVSAGLTPTSRLYFLDQLGEWLNLKLTFNPIKKVEKKLEYASERLAEIRSLEDSKELNKNVAEKIKDKYKNLTEEAEKDTKDLKSKGKDVVELVKKMEEISARHTAVLQKVLEKVPEQAKDAIQKVLESSQAGHKQAIEAIQKEVNEGKIKTEDLKDEVKSQIKPREREESEELEELNIESENKEIENMVKELDKDELSDMDKGVSDLENSVR